MMKRKSKKPVAITPPEEPALTGNVTDTPPKRKFPPPMAVMKCEINFDVDKIKELMAKHGLLDKLEEPKNPDTPKE